MDVNVIYTSNNRLAKTNLPCAIAFDLDETLGSFSDFYSIWARLEEREKTQTNFNAIMDIYPEFLRVGILSILRYIKSKQDIGVCLPIYIYTNNQCEDVCWIYKLIEYLEYRVSPKIFARPICAFKIRGKRIESGRTTHEKTYADFVRCSMLSASQELCFIDDVYYRKMKNRKVFYIQPPPYVHRVPHREVIDRFLKSDVYKKIYPDRLSHRFSPGQNIFLQSDTDSDIESETEWSEKDERKITNKIMYNIREFFLIHSRKRLTKKREYRIGNFTRKLTLSGSNYNFYM